MIIKTPSEYSAFEKLSEKMFERALARASAANRETLKVLARK